MSVLSIDFVPALFKNQEIQRQWVLLYIYAISISGAHWRLIADLEHPKKKCLHLSTFSITFYSPIYTVSNNYSHTLN